MPLHVRLRFGLYNISMDSKTCRRAASRVRYVRRLIRPRFSEWKKLTATALKLLYSWQFPRLLMLGLPIVLAKKRLPFPARELRALIGMQRDLASGLSPANGRESTP